MSEMIEKMAQAMVEDFEALPATERDRDATNSSYLLSQETVRKMAHAALTALGEPTLDMIVAGAAGAEPEIRTTQAAAVWLHMIAAAKGGEDE